MVRAQPELGFKGGCLLLLDSGKLFSVYEPNNLVIPALENHPIVSDSNSKDLEACYFLRGKRERNARDIPDFCRRSESVVYFREGQINFDLRERDD